MVFSIPLFSLTAIIFREYGIFQYYEFIIFLGALMFVGFVSWLSNKVRMLMIQNLNTWYMYTEEIHKIMFLKQCIASAEQRDISVT